MTDVNSLQKDGFIEVDGKQLNLDFFLGEDYKVYNLITKTSTKTCPHIQFTKYWLSNH